jgi:hypothetical protein
MKGNKGFVSIPIVIGLLFVVLVGGYFAFGSKQSTVTLPPNTARIEGIIVAIDPNYTGRNAADPCSKFACQATVRIVKVFGYGMAFSRPFSNGEEIAMRFAFTLSPTEEVKKVMQFNIDTSWPGLHVGSDFIADVTATGIDNEETPYTIFDYSYPYK